MHHKKSLYVTSGRGLCIFTVAILSTGCSIMRTAVVPPPVSPTHSALSTQLSMDLRDARKMRDELAAAQRKSKDLDGSLSADAVKMKAMDASAAQLMQAPLLNRKSTGSFCGTAIDMLSIITHELKGEFRRGLHPLAGGAYATMPTACVYGVGKTFANLYVEIADFADALMDIRIDTAPKLIVEVMPKVATDSTHNQSRNGLASNGYHAPSWVESRAIPRPDDYIGTASTRNALQPTNGIARSGWSAMSAHSVTTSGGVNSQVQVALLSAKSDPQGRRDE